MLERGVKNYFLGECARIGAIAEKYSSLSRNGVPDWLVTFEGMYLAELKKSEGKLMTNQIRDHKRRAANGVYVWVIDSIDKVNMFITALLLNREYADAGLIKRVKCFEDLNGL